MLCRYCKETIADGALKCIHCDSRQDWRRFLDFSSTMLSLLIALGSVSALAVPIIVRALSPPESRVSAFIVHVGPIDYLESASLYKLAIHFAISNPGERGGVLLDGRLRLIRNGAALASGTCEIDSDKSIVQPMASYIARAYVQLEEFDPGRIREDANHALLLEVDHVEVTMRSLRHDGSVETLVLTTNPTGIEVHR